MTAPQKSVPTSTNVRLIHHAMIGGVLLFGLVTHFQLKPALPDPGIVSVYGVQALFAVALVACTASLLLRRRIPERSREESADVFWAAAGTPALITWAPLEATSLFGVLIYRFTGSVVALAIVAVVLLLFIGLNPAYLEKR